MKVNICKSKMKKMAGVLCTMLMLVFLFPSNVFAMVDNDYENMMKRVGKPTNECTYGVDPWGMCIKECTSYVAYRLSKDGFDLAENGLYGDKLGHARTWGYKASEKGYTVDGNPEKGAVAWIKNGEHGHVAYVISVKGDWVEIEDYNSNFNNEYSHRWEPKNKYDYIHFIPKRKPIGDFGNEFYARIKNVETGRYLTEIGKTSSGDSNVQTEYYTGGDNQVWKFIKKADNWYEIENMFSGKLLDLDNANPEANTNIKTYPRHGVENAAQLWGIFRGKENAYLQSKVTGKTTLDESRINNNIYAYTHHGQAPQTFSIELISKKQDMREPLNIGDVFYAKLQNSHTGLYVTQTINFYNNGFDVRTIVETYDQRNLWKFIRKADNWYEIENVYSGKLLDVDEGIAESGRNIKTYSRHGIENKAQLWGIFKVGEDIYLQSKLSGKVTLDEHQETHNIYLYNHHGEYPQRFKIIKQRQNYNIYTPNLIYPNTDKPLPRFDEGLPPDLSK